MDDLIRALGRALAAHAAVAKCWEADHNSWGCHAEQMQRDDAFAGVESLMAAYVDERIKAYMDGVILRLQTRLAE